MSATTDSFADRMGGLLGPGCYGAGDNLYLRVTSSGVRGWIFRYTVAGLTRDMGLGGCPAISLEAARALAAKARMKLQEGIDPIDERKSRRPRKVRWTFEQAALRYVFEAERRNNWTAKYSRQVWRRLETFAFPSLAQISVDDITEGDILGVLSAQWNKKTSALNHVRLLIEAVLEHAGIDGMNYAWWRGRLRHKLPSPTTIRRQRTDALPKEAKREPAPCDDAEFGMSP